MKSKEPERKHNWIKPLFILTLLTGILVLFIPVYLYLENRDFVFKGIDSVQARKIGIVFGASVNPNRTPSDMLKDRLDTAVDLYNKGKIQKVIVSGDNSTKRYNEPQIMYEYLVKNSIPSEDIFRDYAGLRTYDTCVRAKTLWNVNKAILITQEYHLYRAIYTCNILGINSIGFSATRHYYLVEETYKIREYFALIKSFFDLNILKPDYIGGKVEADLSE